MSTKRLLFFYACAAAFAGLPDFLRANGFDVTATPIPTHAGAIADHILSGHTDLVVVEDLCTCPRRGLEVAGEIRQIQPLVPLIFATTEGHEELAVAAFRAGLQDYIKLPVGHAVFLERLKNLLGAVAGSPARATPAENKPDGQRMIGLSGSLQQTKDYLLRAAQTSCTVLVTGETGTGKELAAKFVHENSCRRAKPFICINCAAIPDSLLESELFGYTRGAFTDAREVHDGLLRAANGGTVFLDEIGDMSPFAQAKILRVLDTKEVCRLGETRRAHLDIRFVAATNQDLVSMAANKTFRQDLLFRLDVAHVHLPPLRERKDDIGLLVHEFSREFAPAPAREPPEFSGEFLRGLLNYDWPGNIRELRNMIESLFLLQLPSRLGVEHLPMHMRQCLAGNENLDSEKQRLLSALLSTKWNKTRAAEKLKWSRMTLYRKIVKYRLTNQSAAILGAGQSLPSLP